MGGMAGQRQVFSSAQCNASVREESSFDAFERGHTPASDSVNLNSESSNIHLEENYIDRSHRTICVRDTAEIVLNGKQMKTKKFSYFPDPSMPRKPELLTLGRTYTSRGTLRMLR